MSVRQSVCMCVYLCKNTSFSQSAGGYKLHFETVPHSKKLQMTIEIWLLKDFKKHCKEDILEKREVAHFAQFHLFPQCFPKAFFYMEERVTSHLVTTLIYFIICKCFQVGRPSSIFSFFHVFKRVLSPGS